MARPIDPSDWFEIEDRKQAAYEARLPHCDLCGEPMDEWYRIRQKFGDLLVCEGCIEHEYYEEG